MTCKRRGKATIAEPHVSEDSAILPLEQFWCPIRIDRIVSFCYSRSSDGDIFKACVFQVVGGIMYLA